MKNLSEFIVTAPKPGGTKPGAIGHFFQSKEMYLLKLSLGGYQTVVSEFSNDTIFIECLTALLIRNILGENYAAETLPVYLDLNRIKLPKLTRTEGNAIFHNLLFFNEEENHDIDLSVSNSNNIGLVSRYLKVNNFRYDFKDTYSQFKLDTIIRLLGIEDIKGEHFISHTVIENGRTCWYTALIDCAGRFDGYNCELDELIVNDDEVYLELLYKILYNFSQINITEMINKLGKINLSKHCLMNTNENLGKTVSHIEDTLLPELLSKISRAEKGCCENHVCTP